MRRTFALFVAILLANPATADEADEAAVKAAGLPTDGPALLDFIQQRSRETADKDELAPLLKDLGSPDPKVAEPGGGRSGGPRAAGGSGPAPGGQRPGRQGRSPSAPARPRPDRGPGRGRPGRRRRPLFWRRRSTAARVEALLDYLPVRRRRDRARRRRHGAWPARVPGRARPIRPCSRPSRASRRSCGRPPSRR